jgi:hypothetical protein
VYIPSCVREGHEGVFVRSVRCLFAFALGRHRTRGLQIRFLQSPLARPNGRNVRRNGVWSVGNIVEG